MEKELKQYIGNVDEFVALAKEKIAALQAHCDRYEKALKEVIRLSNAGKTLSHIDSHVAAVARKALNGEGEVKNGE